MVIAGGRSVRFGGEKPVAGLADKPLLMWAAQRLARSYVAVAINARQGTEAEALARAEGLTVLHDIPGDATGRLSGVKVGFQCAQELGASAIAVSPCDVPLLTENVFARLIREAGTGAAVAETSEGHQPQCAVWSVSALPKLTAALANGAHPPTWLMLESIGAVRVRFSPPETFANVNTRPDLAAIAGRLGRGECQLR